MFGRNRKPVKDMIRLKSSELVFSFPEVHPSAELEIEFQRTLRIPDDGTNYPLPPGLGPFPLRLVDSYPDRIPERWIDHGGVMLPMYQSEALWINFATGYPCAVKVAAGKINAVTGDAWDDSLHRDPQDYVVVPEQPWLDGFAVGKGVIRQFVAMPLGSGYSAEEQLTGAAETGGLQIIAYPMKPDAFERYRARQIVEVESSPSYKVSFSAFGHTSFEPDMGLAPGGTMRQEIFDDSFDFDDWDLEHSARCFVHLANSMVWRQITGEYPPTVPPTAVQYDEAGLPWFDFYDEESSALPGSRKLEELDSVRELGEKKGDKPLPENQSVKPSRVIELRRGLAPDQVREGRLRS